MRTTAWAPVWGALFAAFASAEPDGAVAEPARWTGPNGPPSNSRRSRALPVTRDVVAAWSVALPGEAVAPPVTWDGTAYVLCAAREGAELVAVDVAKGVLVAKKILPAAPRAPIHVWGGVVYVRSSAGQISGMRPVGSSFIEKWKLASPESPSMTVFEGEMYLAAGGALVRASPGLKDPLWSVPGTFHGPPAIYGDSVLAIEIDRHGIGNLVSHDRRTGRMVAKTEIGMPALAGQQAAPIDITAGADHLLVRPPWPIRLERGTASDVFVSYGFEGNLLLNLEARSVMNFRVKAAVYKGGLIGCESEEEWHWWRGPTGQVIAHRKNAPDLFKELVAPTVVGNVVYFGTWAADVDTSEILWRLPVRSVRFGIVPADRLLLAVDGERKLHAFKSRVGR